MAGHWLDKPWVVVNCIAAATHPFDTRDDAVAFILRRMGTEQLILYPDSDYRILSAPEVRAIEAVGATIFDDFGQSNVWR